LGLYTRIASITCIAVFLFITFIVGDGKFWYQDQHPFLFVLLGMLFLVVGPGAWSVDGRKKNRNADDADLANVRG
jgi:putative oxidoreductase